MGGKAIGSDIFTVFWLWTCRLDKDGDGLRVGAMAKRDGDGLGAGVLALDIEREWSDDILRRCGLVVVVQIRNGQT